MYMRVAGKTHCQHHSRPELGYLRDSAAGSSTNLTSLKILISDRGTPTNSAGMAHGFLCNAAGSLAREDATDDQGNRPSGQNGHVRACRPPGDWTLPLEAGFPVPVIRVRIGRETLRLMVDSGGSFLRPCRWRHRRSL